MTSFLADRLGFCAVEEYARAYLRMLDRPYAQGDLTEIARGQLDAVKRAIGECPDGVVSDTHLLVIRIWSEWKYGSLLPELEEIFDVLLPDLYVLCKPDIPWEYDVMRESPKDREALYGRYHDHVRKSGIPYVVAETAGASREERVLADIMGIRKTLP